MSVVSVEMTVAGSDSVSFWASRADETACLAIRSTDTHCDIKMDPAVVDHIRLQLPTVLAGLDLQAAETAGCAKAVEIQQRAAGMAARAFDLADTARQAGDHKLAASLQEAAVATHARAKAVEAAVAAVEEAAVRADQAAERWSTVSATPRPDWGR